MTHSGALLYFSVSFIAGLFADSIYSFPQPIKLGVLFFGLILTSVLWRHKKMAVLGLSLVFLVFGVLKHQEAESKIINSEIGRYNESEQEVILTGRIVREPDARVDRTRLTVKVLTMENSFDGVREIVEGERVLATTNLYPQYDYGDKVKIKGRLRAPFDSDDFSYKDYLAKDGIYSVVYWPEIELLQKDGYRDPMSFALGKIFDFKKILRESLYKNISPPEGAVLGAMILGDNSRLSDRTKENLNASGLRHITAVSGTHVVILSGVLMSFFVGLGLWRNQAFYFSIILIFSFVAMTGLPPSGVRAGIMGGFFLLAQYFGRKADSSRAAVLAAAVMLFQNPLLLLLDVGFQLSFLAVLGIIYFGPHFTTWLKPLLPKTLAEIFAMTLSAQIAVLPLIVYNFGRVPFAAPLSNILVLPVVPLIMISGFVFVLGGMIWGGFGWILSLFSWILVSYMLKIADFFSAPWAAKSIAGVHWLWMVFSYLILGYLAWRLRRKERLKFLE